MSRTSPGGSQNLGTLRIVGIVLISSTGLLSLVVEAAFVILTAYVFTRRRRATASPGQAA